MQHFLLSIQYTLQHDSPLSPPAFFIFPPHSLPPSLFVLSGVFFTVSDMAMERNREMIRPTAWREQHSHYNSADVYCCWQCRAHCNINKQTHTEHAHGCTHIFNRCAHTNTHKDVYVNRPGLEQRHGYRCTHVCFPPGTSRPFIYLLQTLMQGSDLFSLPAEKPLAFSTIGHVYMYVKNVIILRQQATCRWTEYVCTEGCILLQKDKKL